VILTRILLRIGLALMLGLSMVAPAASAGADSATPTVKVSVTSVLVNEDGGVSLAGVMACPQTGKLVLDGNFAGDQWIPDDGTGSPVPVTIEPGDGFAILTNVDNYTVSQVVAGVPASAQHVSHVASACYAYRVASAIGRQQCRGNTGCTWMTTQWDWDYSTAGPYFDTPTTGAFLPGKVSVTGEAIGLAVLVWRGGASGPDDEFDALYSLEPNSPPTFPYQARLVAKAS
jgi:hypothetical protein